jgi:chromate transporter
MRSELGASPTSGSHFLLDGLNVASLALLAWVTWQMLRSALVDLPTTLIALASALALLPGRLNPAWSGRA